MNQTKRKIGVSALLIVGCSLMACQSRGVVTQLVGQKAASAVMESRSGSAVAGQVDIYQTKTGLAFHVTLSGLAPNSTHGFHVHANGDCSAVDATSAGGHFNPQSLAHQGPTGHGHAGDLPNVVANAQGMVDTTIPVNHLSLQKDAATDVQGRSLIVHADPDDYTSQPSGNSGKRLACGVIRMATP